jgi:hypothetical protein
MLESGWAWANSPVQHLFMQRLLKNILLMDNFWFRNPLCSYMDPLKEKFHLVIFMIFRCETELSPKFCVIELSTNLIAIK